MIISVFLTIVTYLFCLFIQIFTISYYSSTISVSTKVLSWVKTKTSGITERSCHLSVLFGSMGLTCILNNFEFIFFSKLYNFLHVCNLSKQMNWKYCSCL